MGYCLCILQLLPLYVMEQLDVPCVPGLFLACLFSGSFRYFGQRSHYLHISDFLKTPELALHIEHIFQYYDVISWSIGCRNLGGYPKTLSFTFNRSTENTHNKIPW